MLRSAAARLVAPAVSRSRRSVLLYAPLVAPSPSPSLSFSTARPNMSAPHPVHSTAHASDPAAAVPASGAPTTPAPAPAPQAAAAANANAAQKQPKEKKPKKAGDLAQGMAALELDPKPEYLASRVEIFERLKKEADDKLASQSLLSLARRVPWPARQGRPDIGRGSDRRWLIVFCV